MVKGWIAKKSVWIPFSPWLYEYMSSDSSCVSLAFNSNEPRNRLVLRRGCFEAWPRQLWIILAEIGIMVNAKACALTDIPPFPGLQADYSENTYMQTPSSSDATSSVILRACFASVATENHLWIINASCQNAFCEEQGAENVGGVGMRMQHGQARTTHLNPNDSWVSLNPNPQHPVQIIIHPQRHPWPESAVLSQPLVTVSINPH